MTAGEDPLSKRKGVSSQGGPDDVVPDRNLGALHRLALLAAIGVFPLILAGAGVTSRDAGMAYPDWPTSGGHLLNPPDWWQALDTRWEHGHRLIGWTVGMLATALALMSLPHGRRIRGICLGAFAAIAVQGLLGGLRVNLVSTPLAMVHGIWGQICFCLTVAAALVTSRHWEPHRVVHDPAPAGLKRLCMATSSAIFVQLVFGAALRHMGGSHALIAHLAWSFVVVLLAGWTAMWMVAEHSGRVVLGWLGRALGVLMIVQLLLGAMAWLATIGGFPLWTSPVVYVLVPSVHVGAGALLLACSVLLTLCAFRFLSPVEEAPGPAIPGGMIA